MTFATVSQALNQGYAISAVIKSILRMNTPLAKSIKEALKQGYNEDQIGEYLEKGKSQSYSQRNKMLPGMTEEEKARGIAYRQPKSEKNIGHILQTAAMAAPVAAAGYAAGPAIGAAMGRAMPIAQQALQRAAPQLMGPGAIPGGGAALAQTNVPTQNQPLNLAQQTTSPIAQSPQQPPINQVASNIAQQSQPAQPKLKSINANEIINKHNSKEKIDELIKSGNGPQEIMGFFKRFYPKIATDIEKESGQPFEKLLEQYISENPKQEEMKVEEVEEPRKIEKNTIVASPHGVGEVKEIRNGKALIDIDGKLHKVSEDELEPSLFSDDEVADAYDNIMAKIPEEHRSGFISWAGYDEDRNVLGFIPRGGKYEELENISPTEAFIIKEGIGTARTSGENREGLWVVGEDTRGGLISQIIWDRKHKHQANEKKQLTLGLELPKKEKEDKGMKPIFDEMAYAREKSRERERKVKLAEKERKKKEKDEAKKRKK